MTLDEKILVEIIEGQKSHKLDYILHLGKVTYLLDSVTITKSSTPVNRPTTRGGIYFSDTFAFKIKAVVGDLSIVELLSKSMLGPNPEFQELEITTNVPIKDSIKKVTFFVNLTNSMQSSSHFELNMTIIRLKIG
ncbi:MAG: hypothetical protein ACREAJ_02495 [Nitrosopumilaceae archaeon]